MTNLVLKRASALAAVIVFLLCAPALAETIVEVFEVHYTDAEEIEGAVRIALSEEGTATVSRETNMIIVRDRPENIEIVRRLLAKLDKRPKNINVTVEFIEKESLNRVGVDIRFRAGGGGWSIATIPAPAAGRGVSAGVSAIHSSLKSRKRQTLKTLEGRPGRIFVGTSVAIVNYVYHYGLSHGYITRDTTFKNAGVSFSVTADTMPEGRIRVTIAPEVSYYDRQSGSFTVKDAAATVVLDDPGMMVIASTGGSADSFEANLLSGAAGEKSGTEMVMVLSVSSED